VWGQRKKCEHGEAERATGTEEADTSRAKRPRTLPTPSPLEASGLLQAVIKGNPEVLESLLAGGAEVGEKQRVTHLT
jgi:hypothetical protein